VNVPSDDADSQGMLWLPRSFDRRTLMRSAVGASLGASALMAAACGGSDSRSAKSGTPASGTIKRGGVLKYAITDANASEKLDPALVQGTVNDASYTAAIFEGLTSFDEQFNPIPVLATSWKPNEDATEWTFKLREGVRFHDGSPVTSKDVVYTLKRLLDKDLGSALYPRLSTSMSPNGISAPDASTVVLKLKKPDSLLPVALGDRRAKIVKDGTTEFTVKTAIGTGPFKLDSWAAARSWSVSRNPHYWQKGLPYLDKITAVVLPDQSTKLQSVASGENDLGDPLDLSLVPTVENNSALKLMRSDGHLSWVIAFNSTKPPFTDPRVTQAIKIGQDRTKINQTAFQGLAGEVADIPILQDSQFYPDGLTTKPDVERAKALLAEAGYANGLDIELNTSAVAAGMVDYAAAFQQVMKPIGVNVKLKQWPASSYWNKAWDQTPAFQDYWNARHPADNLTLFYQSDAVWNQTKFKDANLDKQISEVFETTDAREQRQKIQDAYAFVSKNVPYNIPVISPQVWVQKKTIQGVKLSYADTISFTRVTRS
jgi:peptide/nickel transport system substrate-binding protein